MCEDNDNKKAITSKKKNKDIIKSLSFSKPEKEQTKLGTGTAQVTSGGNRDDDGSKTNKGTSIATAKEIITGKYSHHVFQCHSN